jgi:hypothetical protein
VLSSRDKGKEREKRRGEERRRGVSWDGFRRKGLKKTGKNAWWAEEGLGVFE